MYIDIHGALTHGNILYRDILVLNAHHYNGTSNFGSLQYEISEIKQRLLKWWKREEASTMFARR